MSKISELAIQENRSCTRGLGSKGHIEIAIGFLSLTSKMIWKPLTLKYFVDRKRMLGAYAMDQAVAIPNGQFDESSTVNKVIRLLFHSYHMHSEWDIHEVITKLTIVLHSMTSMDCKHGRSLSSGHHPLCHGRSVTIGTTLVVKEMIQHHGNDWLSPWKCLISIKATQPSPWKRQVVIETTRPSS